MYRFWRFGLKLPFGRVFGAYFPRMTSIIVLTTKGPFLGGNTSFEPFSVRISATVRPGRVTEKKNTGQQKSQKCYISPIWWKTPTGPIRPRSCTVGDVRDVITCAKFQIEIFMAYDFTRRRMIDFPNIFAWALQQCSASALPVIRD